MTRYQLIERVKARRKAVGITVDNLSKVSELGYRTVTRFLAGDDVKISTVEKVTYVLGLDLAGNPVIDLDTLIETRAEERARYIVSLVQDTSSLEMQGLESEALQNLILETKEQFLSGEYRDRLWAR